MPEAGRGGKRSRTATAGEGALPILRSAPVPARSNVKIPCQCWLETCITQLPLVFKPTNLLVPVCLSSSDWQSAVSRIVNPQAVRTSNPPSFAARRTMILPLPRETKTAWEAVLGICRGGKGPPGRASGSERVTRRGEGEAPKRITGAFKSLCFLSNLVWFVGTNIKIPANTCRIPH